MRKLVHEVPGLNVPRFFHCLFFKSNFKIECNFRDCCN